MRADRLLKLMMTLQGRGRKTGRELAKDLEVSIRTLYRDLRALETAGVPLVTEPGPGGGVALMEDFRSDLTGLTEREAEALFAAGVSGPLVTLGMGVHLEAALAKLAASSPARLKGREEKARRRILLDVAESGISGEDGTSGEADSGGTEEDTLAVLRDAVMAGKRVRFFQDINLGPVRGARVERIMEPYGLVWSGGKWYAVGYADGRVRAIMTSEITEAAECEETADGGRFDIPEGFDLGDFWKRERAYVAAFRTSYPVRLKMRRDAVPWLGKPYASRAMRAAEGVREEDAMTVELRFSSAEEARSRLAALGGAAEILAPMELRQALADLGSALIRAHGNG